MRQNGTKMRGPSDKWQIYRMKCVRTAMAGENDFRLSVVPAIDGSPRAELYTFDDGGLNAFGQYLIRQGNLRDAIRAFESNVEIYPASGRAADALATAYEMDHNVPSARHAYRTAVTLDPTLSHARDRLKHLKQ